MNTNWILTFHKHFGELLLILPLVVILVALTKGKSPLPRITAVLLDIQLVFGLLTFALVMKGFCVLHVVCMILAIGLAHAFAKKEPKKVAVGFSAVLALIVVGYLFEKQILPFGDIRVSL